MKPLIKRLTSCWRVTYEKNRSSANFSSYKKSKSINTIIKRTVEIYWTSNMPLQCTIHSAWHVWSLVVILWVALVLSLHYSRGINKLSHFPRSQNEEIVNRFPASTLNYFPRPRCYFGLKKKSLHSLVQWKQKAKTKTIFFLLSKLYSSVLPPASLSLKETEGAPLGRNF